MLFLGEYLHSVDGKGRIAVPTRFRSKIERGAVVTRGIEPCLYVYSIETWEQKARELETVNLDARQRRIVERRLFAPALDIELDAQGRLLVPPKLRQYAGLNGDAAIIGARDRFELWSAERWQAYTAELEAEDLSSLPLPF